MRRAWPLLLALVLGGCSGSDDPVARTAGSYSGQFMIESVAEDTNPKAIDAETMKGTLALYATASKFKLEMASAKQGFTVTGKWSAEKNRVKMMADNFEFKNPSDEDQKGLGLRIVTPDEVRSTFKQTFVLDAAADRRKLTGLKTSLGRLLGRFEFERPIPH